MVNQHSGVTTDDVGGITMNSAERVLVRAVWLRKGRESVSGPRLVDGIKSVTAALGSHGSFSSVRGGMPPACITGDHEGFQTGNGAGDDDIIFMNLHPDTGQHSAECWVGREELDVEVMETDNDESNDPDHFLDSP